MIKKVVGDTLELEERQEYYLIPNGFIVESDTAVNREAGREREREREADRQRYTHREMSNFTIVTGWREDRGERDVQSHLFRCLVPLLLLCIHGHRTSISEAVVETLLCALFC